MAFQTVHDNTNCKQQSMVTVGNYNIDNGQYKQLLLKKFQRTDEVITVMKQLLRNRITCKLYLPSVL